MNAGVADNVATIVFDVVVYPDAPDGTVISNQAFVSAVDQGVADVPSDDPRTEVPDDPTIDVVGNYPLLFAPKVAALQVDGSSPGIVDPLDVLRYTITVYNNGTVPATLADLTDLVPANTTYVADSVTLNGEPVGQPDGGVFPLIDGIPISSADLTPPLPGDGEGILNPGESAVVQFDLQVNDAVPAGTLITNQAAGLQPRSSQHADRRRRQSGNGAGTNNRCRRRCAADGDHQGCPSSTAAPRCPAPRSNTS